MSSFSKSPWIIHYDAASCNGCDIETLACLTPLFDVELFGIVNTGNPKHADIFVVTGGVNEQAKDVIRNIYSQMPEPKVVVAVGVCAASGGIFRECYNISGGVDTVIPVDVYVPGCAARPEAIIDGVVTAIGVLERRVKVMAAANNVLDQTVYSRADESDVPELLALQRSAHAADAELYGEANVPLLQQTQDELLNEFDRLTFVKAVLNGRMIGAARGSITDQTAQVGGLVVHPYFRRQGTGQRLLKEMEDAFPEAKRFETSTGQKNESNLAWLQRNGYQTLRTEVLSPAFTRVILQKERK